MQVSVGFVRAADLGFDELLRDPRMAGLVRLRRSGRRCNERQQWAVTQRAQGRYGKDAAMLPKSAQSPY